jgi:hypothetical protein
MCNSAIEFAEDKSPEVVNMNAESIIMLLVSAGLMLYALLRPEKF